MTSSAVRTTPTLRYFERRAEAFDRLYTRQSPGTRLLRGGPLRVDASSPRSSCGGTSRPDVLDLGCGPGRVAEAVLDAGAASYTWGRPLAPHARARARAPGHPEPVELVQADFLDVELPPPVRTSCLRWASSITSMSRRAPPRGCAPAAPRRSSPRSPRRDRMKAPLRPLHYELLQRLPGLRLHRRGRVEKLLRAAGFSLAEVASRGPPRFPRHGEPA